MRRKVSKVASLAKNLSIMFILMVMIPSCSLLKKDQPAGEKGETLTPPKSEAVTITLFYPKLDSSGLVKVQIQTEDAPKTANQWIIRILTELSQPKGPDTFAVFPEKTDFYSLFFDKDIMYLDFSPSIQKAMFPSIQLEQLALQAFLLTLKANFPLIQQVKILSEHEDSQIVFGHTYAQQPFSLKDL
jgi:hypothetical protein